MIGSLLVSAGASLLGSLVESGTQVAKTKAKEFIKEKTGVDIDKEKPTPQQLEKIAQAEREHYSELYELMLKDRADARSMNVKIQQSKDWLVRNTGSLIALFTIFSAFILDVYILYKAFSTGLDTLNPIVTLIAGATSTKAVQVLGFYFGDSKVNADAKR